MEDMDNINTEAVEFFSNLCKEEHLERRNAQNKVLGGIPRIISKEDNRMLMETIKMSELKAAVFGLGGDKEPGLDGFQAFFYQKFWDILKGSY